MFKYQIRIHHNLKSKKLSKLYLTWLYCNYIPQKIPIKTGLRYEHCQLPIMSENSQIMHFLREATGPICTDGSGLKEKTILASIRNYQFAINAKSQIKTTRIQSVLKERKSFKSHTFKEYFSQHIIWKIRMNMVHILRVCKNRRLLQH